MGAKVLKTDGFTKMVFVEGVFCASSEVRTSYKDKSQ